MYVSGLNNRSPLYYNDGMLIDDLFTNGGEGETHGGWAKIEDDEQGCIPSRSTIRFILGQNGESYNDWHSCVGSGGGSGTGILILPPNARNGACGST